MSRPAALRAAAARVVLAVAFDGRSLDTALAEARRAVDDPRDRALLTSLCYESVRWFLCYQAAAKLMLDKPIRRRDAIVECLLVVGMTQIERMRIPAHAAVAETVEAARQLDKPRVAGMVNALLRRFQREHDRFDVELDAHVASRHSVPMWLALRLRTDWPKHWGLVLAAGNEPAPMWLRVNRRRANLETYRQRLVDATGVDAEPLAVAPAALKLAKPLDVEALPGFADGEVSVQDAAAQLATGLIDAAPGMRVLDACAAPGGKTCAVLEAVDGELKMTALDIDKTRLDRVRENLERLSLDAEIVAGDATDPAAWWDGEPFDRILLDAPCSASGVIRRHPDIKLLRRDDDIDRLAGRQREMLDALWPMLAPAGRLVYATCSVFVAENAAVIERFVAETDDAVEVIGHRDWGRESGAGRQVLTGEAGMDGFYYACLDKIARDR